MSWLPPMATSLRRDGEHLTRTPAGPLEPLLDAHLRAGSGGLVVLGSFGSGKTELSKRLGARVGVPVVPLRVLARNPGIDLVGTSDVAILDGLDEIGRPGEGGAQALVERATKGLRAWILTSRPGHVRTDLSEPDPLQLDCFHLPILEIDPYPPPEGAPAWLAEHPVLFPLWRAGHHGARPMEIIESFLPDIDALEALAWGAFLDGSASFGPPTAHAHIFVQDLDGRWRFGHRSLYDALVARHLAPRIADHAGLALSGAMRVFLAGAASPWPDAEWVHVPRGPFVRGGSRSADERPLVIADLDHDVLVARSPVTNGDFQRFLDATGPRPGWVGLLTHWRGGRCPEVLLDHPVTNLRPEDCEAYAAWAGARLPTADEWEKAVRTWDGRNFPWGDSFDPARANCASEGTRPVAQSPQGPLYAAIGDTFECTSSFYRDRPDRGRVVMGGSYAHAPMRASLRLSHTLSGHLRLGLRLARDA